MGREVYKRDRFADIPNLSIAVLPKKPKKKDFVKAGKRARRTGVRSSGGYNPLITRADSKELKSRYHRKVLP